MSKTNHVPGPWVVQRGTAYPPKVNSHQIVPVYDSSLPLVSVHDVIKASEDVSKATAARIVECVNACEGIENPSGIPELIEALKISNAEGGSVSPAYWLERLGIR